MNDVTWSGWTNKLSKTISVTLNKKLWFSKISRKQKSHAGMDEPLVEAWAIKGVMWLFKISTPQAQPKIISR